MKTALFLAGSAFAIAACSSDSPKQDPGLTGDGAQVAQTAPDTNPAGQPYPSSNIGTQPRRGATKGNTIQNFKFLGYPDANVSAGLKPISLAQFYDPTGTTYRVIHIEAAGVWCSACQAETRTVVPMKSKLEAKKAVWLVSLAEGPSLGKPSTQKDLDGWITEFKSPYTHWIDPGNQELGRFYDAAALPWNANIDARTMEILTAGVGGQPNEDGVLKEIDDAIAMSDAK